MRHKRRLLDTSVLPRGSGGNGSGTDGSMGDAAIAADTAADRIAQIQAAIRRGEAKAARQTAGEIEETPEGAPRQLTLEQEEALKKMFVQPAESEPIDVESIAPSTGLRACDFRIQKTLEFCPDGVLARDILFEMRANGTIPGPDAYNSVIEALAHRGLLDDALAVFKEMQQARVQATDVTYDALARPASRSGQYRFVETLYRAKASDFGGSIGAESLSLLLQAYANGRPPQPEKAEAAFRGEMGFAEEQGVPVKTAASAVVLNALQRAVGSKLAGDLCSEYEIDSADML